MSFQSVFVLELALTLRAGKFRQLAALDLLVSAHTVRSFVHFKAPIALVHTCNLIQILVRWFTRQQTHKSWENVN